MSFLHLVLRSLQFHAAKHFAVILGVMAATAVLTGALVVGESVRQSLRHLALDRLGAFDHLLLVDRFFRAELAGELQQTKAFQDNFALAVPAIIIPTATAERPHKAGGRSLASGVQLIAAEPSFWNANGATLSQPSVVPPKDGEVILNATLAKELEAKIGDVIIIRMAKATQVSEDSPLGKKTDRLTSLAELKVREIIPDERLGRFSLHPMQVSPRNAFVNLAALQLALEQEGKVNALLVAAKDEARGISADRTRELQAALRPTLADYGLALKHVQLQVGGEHEPPVLDYFSLSSNRMLLDENTERIARTAFKKHGAYPALTYLANSIDKIGAPEGTKGVPYSTITAIDPAPDGPLVDENGKPLPPLADDEIAVTEWLRRDQDLKIGDRLRITYFEPETTHGDEKELTEEFTVKAFVPLTEPSAPYSRRKGPQFTQAPTRANDPDLTPEVPGVTDQATIADWDAPFPFEYKRVRKQDDKYWNDHRTTPKAYVSLRAGQKLWQSRFGRVTSIHIPVHERMTAESLAAEFQAQLEQDHELLGFELTPIKARDLESAAGTTPFDVLFLLLSMFIIGAALLLIWLLFRLNIEQRASEIGLLLALGWSQPRTQRWLSTEGIFVSALGSLLGVAAGIGYAALMIEGLRTWWVGAISSPFLTLHVGWQSLAIGFVVGLVVAQGTIYFSLRQLRKVSPRQLLAGETSSSVVVSSSPVAAWRVAVPYVFLVVAFLLAILASVLKAEAQAGTFLASGAAVLTGLLMLISRGLQSRPSANVVPFRSVLPALALRNIGRARGRSIATIALVASACFLVVAVSSFRLSPTEQGVGGFNLIGESSESILTDLNDPAARQDALGKDVDEQFNGSLVIPLRMRGGDDASCRNLYQAQQPRVLGVTPSLIGHFDSPESTRFVFAASAAKTAEEKANPWRLLAAPSAKDEPVNVVLDMNTALYSLKLYGGIGQEFEKDYGDGPPIKFRVVGLLSNSVLQGSLLIGEADFKRTFPRLSGYRSFLIRTTQDKQAAIASVLEDKFGDEGLDVTASRDRLRDLLAVQNTYISTFQALGALGLLLGTFGLAAVQLRNVLERRKELAMLRAIGFRRERLAGMVLLENLLLLCGGLFTGLIAALIAVLPHVYFGGVSLPWLELLAMLAAILVIGGLVGLVAVRATLRAPLLMALRGE